MKTYSQEFTNAAGTFRILPASPGRYAQAVANFGGRLGILRKAFDVKLPEKPEAVTDGAPPVEPKEAAAAAEPVSMTMTTEEIIENAKLNAERARVCIESWKDPDGADMLPKKPEDARNLLMDRPRVVAWVNKMAAKLGEELDKDLEEDSGN